MTVARDTHRSTVYSVEDQLANLLARSADGTGTVDFFGSSLTVPVERRFGDLDSVQRYVDWALSHPGVTARWPGLPAIAVRSRAGQAKAHYESATRTIAIPVESRAFMREIIVVHEIAHAIVDATRSDRVAAHGPEFTGTLVSLVTVLMGPEVGLLLRAGYDGAGVPVKETR